MKILSAEMQQCIQNCLDCPAMCLNMRANHCLEAGGKHVEQGHFKLMKARNPNQSFGLLV